MMSEGSLQSGHGDPPAAPPNAVVAALQFVRIVRRRRGWLILALAVSGALSALYYTTAPRIYEARASVLVMHAGSDVWSARTTSDGPRGSLIPTYEKLFTSEVVLAGALKELAELPASQRIDLINVPEAQHQETLRNNLRATGLRNTQVIEISYRSRSPQAAAATVEAVMQSYLDYMAQHHKNVSVEIVATLNQERIQIQEQFHRKERELAAARSRAGDLGLNDQQDQLHPAVERAVRINHELVKVQSERLQLAAALKSVQAAIENGGDLQQHLVAVEPIVGRELLLDGLGLNDFNRKLVPELETRLLTDEARLESLSQHYGPRHPSIVELKQSIDQTRRYMANVRDEAGNRFGKFDRQSLGTTLISIVTEKLSGLRAYETELVQHYQLAEADAIKLNDRFMEVALLEHDLDRLRALHDTLLNRITNLDLQQDQADVRISIVDEPHVDPRPVSPRLRIVALMCLLCGCGCGALLAYIVDLLDDRFRSPEELRDELGAQVLAVIPALAGAGGASPTGAVLADSIGMEAFRTLRTTICFTGEDRNRLVITSAEPGDGKTTVVSQLATSFGLAGKRTLLIDADMRKPGLSKLFRMRGQPGLSDLLRGEEDIAELCAARVRPSGINGVDVLPCGPKPSDPLELLSSARFELLLGWAEAHYDQVLVDTPPVLASSDSSVAGRLTDGVVLVVQPQKNDRRLVIRAAQELRNLRVPLLGIVANRVESSGTDGYFGYGYGYGYGDDDVDEPAAEDVVKFRAAA